MMAAQFNERRKHSYCSFGKTEFGSQVLTALSDGSTGRTRSQRGVYAVTIANLAENSRGLVRSPI
jgi:hypothetical protein